MRIASLKLERNEVLGSMEFNFCDNTGSPAQTIVIAGENGTGKSTLLEIISAGISGNAIMHTKSGEVRTFCLVLDDKERREIAEANGPEEAKNATRFFVTIDFRYDYHSADLSRSRIKVEYDRGAGQLSRLTNSHEISTKIFSFYRSLYTPTEVNFSTTSIFDAKNGDIDRPIEQARRASTNLGTEIGQLIADITAYDDAKVAEWVELHPGQIVPEGLVSQRLKRFQSAFERMFPEKKLTVKRMNGLQKHIGFEQFGQFSQLHALSSGEKQIVFRGAFLLKDRLHMVGSIVLMDEPELSLHPSWQERILHFYKSILSDERGAQQSQLFVVTHSPFIIHSTIEERIVVLSRHRGTGKISVGQSASFPAVTKEEICGEAFNYRSAIKFAQKPYIVWVEGKTDVKIIEDSWKKLRPGQEIPFDIVPAFSALYVRALLSRGEIFDSYPDYRFVGIFDFDSAYDEWNGVFGRETNADERTGLCKRSQLKSHGSVKDKNGFALLLPVPEFRKNFASKKLGAESTLSIEFLFDDTIVTEEFFEEKALPQVDAKYKKFRDSRKTQFSEMVEALPVEKFAHIEPLISTLEKLGQEPLVT